MSKKLPYFDYLLAGLHQGNASLEKSFGLHVHWGYWQQPTLATLSAEDYLQAAEALTTLLYTSANVGDGQSVLDVGCGFGGTIGAINHAFQGMELVGLNIDERQLERARQQISAIGNNTVEFRQGDACALPFADNSFDVVLAVECIFHFPSRERFFQEVHRVLKPGGYLALSDFLLHRTLSKLYTLKVSQWVTNGFFGSCNVKFTRDKYFKLAQESHLRAAFEKNITKNTLPTYKYLKSLKKQTDLESSNPLKKLWIILTITYIEFLSKLGLLEYVVFSFRKP